MTLKYAIGSGCELPWRSLGPDQLTQAVLHERRRPAIAADTPDVLREVVEACWRASQRSGSICLQIVARGGQRVGCAGHDPLARPTFDQVVELLNYGLDDRRLTPRFLPCTEDLRIILRGRIMTPLPPGMLVELVEHVKKEQGWASTLSSLLTNLWAHLRAYLWGLGLRGGGL